MLDLWMEPRSRSVDSFKKKYPHLNIFVVAFFHSFLIYYNTTIFERSSSRLFFRFCFPTPFYMLDAKKQVKKKTTKAW